MYYSAKIYPHIDIKQINDVRSLFHLPAITDDELSSEIQVDPFGGHYIYVDGEHTDDITGQQIQHLENYLFDNKIPCYCQVHPDADFNGLLFIIDDKGNSLSYEIDANHNRIIPVSDLERIFNQIKTLVESGAATVDDISKIQDSYIARHNLSYSDIYKRAKGDYDSKNKHRKSIEAVMRQLDDNSITLEEATMLINKYNLERESI